jgi:hypothetical protein
MLDGNNSRYSAVNDYLRKCKKKVRSAAGYCEYELGYKSLNILYQDTHINVLDYLVPATQKPPYNLSQFNLSTPKLTIVCRLEKQSRNMI